MLRIIVFRKLQPQVGAALLQSVRLESTATKERKKIVLPKPIKRRPTDILHALAATVKRDPTATAYKYIDDPYLAPTSHFEKTQYALSIEAGRKAAHFIKNKHRELFQVSAIDIDRRLCLSRSAKLRAICSLTTTIVSFVLVFISASKCRTNDRSLSTESCLH